ncbi:MAG TPA: tetratricopeptide repeat protein [Polyangiaceae bacterium]|jgi:tetratricopeptide (TPR) repeat protein|nr:tetratricopeptide repeat protein [Polyangiaceae bacterium]
MKRQSAASWEVNGGSEEEPAPASLPGAAAFLERVRQNPADAEAWDELDEVARKSDLPDDISRLYRETLARDLSGEVASALGRRAVAFHDEWFEDPGFVLQILKRVLELDPRAEWAFERLSLLLTMAERWEDLLSAYDVAIAQCDDREKKKALLDEAARIAKDFAGSTDRAISYLKQLVPLRPEDAQLAGSLERRLILQKRYRDLIDVWAARLGVLTAPEVLATRVRMTETWLEKLADAGTALDVVREILAAGAGESQAAKLLERIGTFASAPVETRRASLTLLKQRFALHGTSEDVIRAIELLLGVADAAAERIALRSEATTLLAGAKREGDAVEHAAEWLVLSPTRDVKQILDGLARTSGKAQRYAESLVRAAAATSDGAVRVEFLLEAGRVHDELLDDQVGAIELYSRVLVDPDVDRESLLDVARRLAVLLVGPEHARQRLDVLERLVALEPDDAEQRRILGEAAHLAHALGDVDHSLRLFEDCLARNPADREALDVTVEILEESHRWEALVVALGRRHDASPDAAARRRDLVDIAETFRTNLDNLPLAIDTWRRIESEFGANLETMKELADLSAAAQRWSDVTALLRQAAKQVDEPNQKSAHLSRMGDVYRTQREAPLKAVDAYREALETLPTHEGARAGLRAVLDDAEAGARAVETLAKAYADADEWQGTLGLVERRVQRAKDDSFRRDVLLEAAGILEHRGGDRVAALSYVRAAFALTREASIEQELIRLAEETDSWAACAEGYAEAVAGATEVARRSELLLSHGAILEQRLDDAAGALKSYAEVTELSPTELPAYVALVRVAGVTSRWDVAADALVRSSSARKAVAAELVTTFDHAATDAGGWAPAAKAAAQAVARASTLSVAVLHDLKRQLAVWYRDRLENLDGAQALLREAASHQENADTLRMLAELERRSPDRALAGTLLRLAAATGDDLEILHEAGMVALHSVRDAELSRPILERVLQTASQRWKAALADDDDPGQLSRYALWALEQLVQLWLEANDAAEAEALLESGAALPFSPEKSRELRYRAADLSAERLADVPRAVELCRGILEEAPDDAATIALLAGLYAKEERRGELLELRRRELSLEPPVERRLVLRLDVARVLGEIEGDVAERLAALRDNLADSPGHAESVDAIAELLADSNRHAELHAELVHQAEQVQSGGDRRSAALLWARAGQLAESPLGEVDRALDAYRRSVALDASVGVLDALASIHTTRNEHGAAVGWLEKRLERTGRGAAELATHRTTVLRLARAYHAAGRQLDAERCLTDALADDPGATELRELLAELYRDTKAWGALAPLLADGVEHAPDPAAKVVLLKQAAQVQRRRLGALDSAIPLLERAVALGPEDRAVRLALADALRSANRFDEAHALLEGMLAEFGRRRTPERAAVHYHLARIAQSRGDLVTALSHLESASSIERSDPKILRLLGDVARQKGELEAAERAYRALLLIVRRQQPAAPSEEAEEEPIAASEVMFDLHQMAAEQGQTDRANDLLESAFETAASNNLEALRLERMLRATGQIDLVLRVLDTRLERISDPSASADILVARADLLAETGRLGEALDSLIDALARTPGSVTLLTSAHDLAVRANAVDRYTARLSDLAEGAERTDALLASDLWMRLGAMAENELLQPAQAAVFYERSLATGRRALRAYRALLNVLPDGDTERLGRALKTFVDSSEQDETDVTPRNEAFYRIAELELASPASREDGAVRLDSALDRAPDYERGFRLLRDAVRGGVYTPRLVRVYERVARALGEDTVLLDALALRASLPDATLELLIEATELAHKLGDGARLGTLLERLVAVAKADGAEQNITSALVELAGIREAAKDYAGAAELLEDASKQDGPEGFELGLRLAEMASGPLGDLPRAVRVYERLRQAEPTDPRAWKPLLDVYRKLGAFAELEACIGKTVEVVYDPKERNHLRMERGRILLEDPKRQAEAETVLREVLDEDPDHVQASVVLSELFERTGRVEELNELLDRQLGAAKDRRDAAAVAAISLQIGKTIEKSDRSAAMTLYKDSLKWAPNDRPLLEALLALHGPDDDARDRVAIMERLLNLASGEAAAKLALELAQLATSLEDNAAAEAALRKGYAAHPTSVELREKLIAWYTQRDDFAGLADVLATAARHRTDPAETAQQLREAARLHRDRLGDPVRAADLLAEARKSAPGDVPLVEEYAATAVDAGRPEDALIVLSATIDSGAASPEATARLLAMRAKLRPKVDGYEIPVLAAAIADLDRAASMGQDPFDGDLVELLEAQRLLAGERDDERVERAATMRLAGVFPRLGDQRRGLELLVGWVKRQPNDAEAVRGLGQFAANAEKWGAAAKAYLRLVEITTGADQVDAVIRYAEACERAGAPMDARPALEQVYARSPGDESLRDRLRRMYEAAGAFAELASIMIAEAEQAPDDKTRFERLAEAGDLSLRVEGGERVAIDAYRRAYTIQPEDHRIVIKLSDLLGSVGEIEEAANILDHTIDIFGKRRSPELAELQHSMARIGRIAGDWEAVFAWLDAAVQTDRQNGAAASELAVIAMERGELDIAIKALQAITLLKGDAPMSKAEAYLRQGMIAEQRGDAKKAVFLGKRAVTQDPSYEDARAFLERLGAS